MTWSIYFIFLALDIVGGVEVFSSLSHWATLTSVFHTVVRHCCFTAVGCVCYREALLGFKMVQRITNIIKDYQDRVRELPYVPATSFGRDSLGYPGDANKLFLTFLFCDRSMCIQFLKDVGLIRSKVQCNSCGRDMTWYADPSKLDSCSSPSGSGISLLRYARAITRRCVTDAMFYPSPPNNHAALPRITTPLAAIFGPRSCSRSKQTTVSILLIYCTLVCKYCQGTQESV